MQVSGEFATINAARAVGCSFSRTWPLSRLRLLFAPGRMLSGVPGLVVSGICI